jgi:hypothetical protein
MLLPAVGTPAYTIYLNGSYFGSLASLLVFGDRPEPYRLHEKTLWTIYQLLRLGEHTVVITNEARQPQLSTKRADELKAWVKVVYPDFSNQLDQPSYTRFSHPADQL